MNFDYFFLDLWIFIYWYWFWLIESFYFVVLEYVIEEEIFIVEFKGIDIMGEGFVIFDFVFFVIDIYKVRYNLYKSRL